MQIVMTVIDLTRVNSPLSLMPMYVNALISNTFYRSGSARGILHEGTEVGGTDKTMGLTHIWALTHGQVMLSFPLPNAIICH